MGIEDGGSVRRSDIIVIDRSLKKGYIIDPTVRFEIDEKQPFDVHQEKNQIYQKTIKYYISKYNISKFEVYGILIGSRGTIPKMVQDFWKKFKLDNQILYLIALTSIKFSISILKNHLYNTT